MILQTAYWNTAVLSTPVREPYFITASISHGFNECARALIKISDPDGSMLAKYDSDAAGNEVYTGSGQALLHHEGTCIFNGRILSSERHGTILTLTAEDWLNQMKDPRIHFDFREDLDDSGLRESSLHGALDDINTNYRKPAYRNGVDSFLIDDDMDWSIDDWNDYYVVFPESNFGSIKINIPPSNHDSNMVPEASGWVDTRYPDDGESDFYDGTPIVPVNWFSYTFWVMLTEGSLNPDITGVRFHLILDTDTHDFGLDSLYAYGFYDFTGAAWAHLENKNWHQAHKRRKFTIEIPNDYFSDLVHATGYAKILMDIVGASPVAADIKVYYCNLEIDAEIDAPTLTKYQIKDTIRDPDDAGTKYNTLKFLTTALDPSITGYGFWEGFKYSIVRELYFKISAIITDHDPIVVLTPQVASTDGISTHHASDRTPFEIMQYASDVDAAVFWTPLGTTNVKWVNVTAAAVSAILHDADVLSWDKLRYDTAELKNQLIVYGARIGDDEVTITVNDTTSQDDYGIKTTVIRDAGISSQFEAKAVGDAFVARDKTVHLQLGATIAGLSDIRLGDWVKVDSVTLGLTDEDYTVDRWDYSDGATKIRLQPRGTDGYVKYRDFIEQIRFTALSLEEKQLDNFLVPPKKAVW